MRIGHRWQGRPVRVRCVMHKCIMVKLGGNETHVNYVKTLKFYEIRGKFQKVAEEVVILPKQGGVYCLPKIGGKL